MKPILFNGEIELKEIPITNCEDYRAGNDGKIYSRTRFAGFGMKQYIDWYPLKQHVKKNGYFDVSICNHGNKKTICSHVLICTAFHGSKNADQQVRHLDGNPKNNIPSNLCWGTSKENWNDKRICGTATIGEKHPMSKLSNNQRKEIISKVFDLGLSQRQIARQYNVSQYAIYRTIKQKELYL